LDTVTRLRDALVVRDDARAKLRDLEGDTKRAARQPKTVAAEIRRQQEDIAEKDGEVEALRAKLLSEKEKAEAERIALMEQLSAPAVRQAAGTAGKEEAHLRERLAKLEERLARMQKGLSAQSPDDIPAVISIVPGRDRGTADIMQDPALRRYTQVTTIDWPGASVPERLMMLFKESKKTDSRKAIVISSVVVAVLTLVVLGTPLISGARNPDSSQSPLGKGELYVPVLAADAGEVGRLEMTIEYDAAVLTGLGASNGPLSAAAAIDLKLETPGKMTLAISDVTGVSGSGAIALLRFRVDHIVIEPTPLTVTAVMATDARTMAPVAVAFEDGSVNTGTLESVAPVVRF